MQGVSGARGASREDSALRSLVAKAERAARRRGQSLTSAHLVLMALHDASTGSALAELGLVEGDWLRQLRDERLAQESASVLARILERATALRTHDTLPGHHTWRVLFAASRERRAAAHRGFEALGLRPRQIERLAREALGLGREGAAPPSRAAWSLSELDSSSGSRHAASSGGELSSPGRLGRPPTLSGTSTSFGPGNLPAPLAPRRPVPRRGRTPIASAAVRRPIAREERTILPPPAEISEALPLAGTLDSSQKDLWDETLGRSPDAPESPRPSGRASSRPSARRRDRGETARDNANGDVPRERESRPDFIPADALSGVIDGEPLGPTLTLNPWELDPERFPLLTRLGRNLTALAADGAFDPVIGRDALHERLLDILCRRRSNNPLLVGPPGVGKTAVVEGLAQRLVDGGAGVAGLEGRILIELSASALVGGTGVRGALADKVALLQEEVTASQGRVILFIDEIHAALGGGEGPDDLAHALKTALARGTLPCIGATTPAEARKHIEKDPALARRFSTVLVDEPDEDTAREIMRGIAPRYESHHEVRIEAAAIDSALALSVRFLPERRLPDKAIGVLDLAAARVRRRGKRVVDRAAVAAVIAEQAGVPVERLMLEDGERLLRLEHTLGERVIGHDAVVTRVADVLRKGAAGLRGNRPLGTFLFLGPTGVGKTELAKSVAETFFPGSPITRLDMGEYGEAHSVARMLGAPPGYVGHDEGGQLTEAVRRRPYQLVLLDEVEKAHPDVLLSLLGLLDEGRLTDGKGRTVDFRNVIVVMTSNLGAGVFGERKRSIGFGGSGGDAETAVGERVISAARAKLPPELWNRIDEPLVFHPLERPAVERIAARLFDQVASAARAAHGIELHAGEGLFDALLAAGGFDPTLGARPLRRVLGRLVEAPLAEIILGGDLSPGERIVVDGVPGEAEVTLIRA